jgi:small subunit ribosomal protein S2
MSPVLLSLSKHMETNQQMIDSLFSVGAHFGYAPSRLHPSMSPYLFGKKGGTELFDLEKTAACLQKAIDFVASIAADRKTILFVGGKAEARDPLVRAAERISQPYVAGRWIGGSITNFSEIKKRLNRLTELADTREKGEWAKFTKHERLLMEREMIDLESMFGGLKGMQKIPDALFVVDSKKENGAVLEARQMKIPVIALLNSDCDRSLVDYPIPANDASIATVTYVLDAIAKSYADNLGGLPIAPVTI